MTGLKFDEGKRRWDLLPFEAIDPILDVIAFGANKYAPENWRGLASAKQRYFAALLRHLSKWAQGEIYDVESGLPHLAHAGCNIVFLLSLTDGGTVPLKDQSDGL